MTTPIAHIRELNDRLRQYFIGGKIVISWGVCALPEDVIRTVESEINDFDNFDADNDPYNEHDFGCVTVKGYRIFFKIDAYDTTMTSCSPDAANEDLTVRVLTIMLAEEY